MQRVPRTEKRSARRWWALGLLGVFLTAVLADAQSSPNQGPPDPEPDRPADLAGLVVEEVGKGTALEKAGVRPGDELFAWRRLPRPPANPDGARGRLDSYFDWWWMFREQAPRGTLELTGRRDAKPVTFAVPPGTWEAQVRPVMTESALETYLAGQEHLDAGEPQAAVHTWSQLVESGADWRLRCWILLRTAETWDEAHERDRALEAYRSALDEAGDPRARGVIQLAVGNLHEKRAEPDLAEEAYRSALETWRRAFGESVALARVLQHLGRLERRRDQVDRAQGYLGDSLEINRRLAPGSLAVASSLNILGSVALTRNDFDRAFDLYRDASEIYRDLAPRTLFEAAGLNNLAIVEFRRGDLASAADMYQRAFDTWVAVASESPGLATILNNLGTVALDRGDLEQAAEHLRHALEIIRRIEPGTRNEARTLLNLGNVYRERGDLDGAEDAYRRALEIYRKVAPESRGVAYTMNSLGRVAYSRGDPDGARERYLSALELFRELSPDNAEVATTLSYLGQVAEDGGDLDQAAEYQQQALGIWKKFEPSGLEVARSLSNLGRLAEKRSEIDRATELYRQAVGIFAVLAPGTFQEAEALFALGTFDRRANHTRALDYFRRSIDAVEHQIGRLGVGHDAGADFRARYDEFYRGTVELLLELDQPEEAFHVLERFRARGLLALLAERDTVFSADIPEELDRERRRLAVVYDRTLADQYSEPEGETEIFVERLRQLRREADDIAEKIRRASPRLAALRYPRPLTHREARETLDPGTVLLSYSVGQERTDLFVTRRGAAVEVVRIDVGEDELRLEVNRFRRLITRAIPGDSFGNRDLETLEVLGRRLYTSLIEPAAGRIAMGKRLLIVPDGPLHQLPFGALIRDDGAYLVEWKPLSSVLSATLYAELRKSRRPDDDRSATRIAAFGDPHYPREGTASFGGFRLRSAAERGLFDWRPLPYTRREVVGIDRLYPEEAVEVYLGEDATEDRLKSLGKGPRIVHIAAHGHFDDQSPLDSFVALAIPEAFTEGRDNGLLQVWEIFERVRLDADLVVLSACRSGLGEELGGEGLIGLTRSFQYAGARSVVATFWSVADRATAELMVRFHRHLLRGLPRDEALRSAQLELIREPLRRTQENGAVVEIDASAPYYWAAFQLYGDGH